MIGGGGGMLRPGHDSSASFVPRSVRGKAEQATRERLMATETFREGVGIMMLVTPSGIRHSGHK